jgi:hypothetical protein
MQSVAWERRLGDLGFLLENCAKTYLNPDLFRRNTNQFLQTARTVTFLIQKDKNEINEFDSWYQPNVVDLWKNDRVMNWAKDSRNIIEKRGDLELNSTLEVSLVLSYFTEEDIHIDVGREELIHFGIAKLLHLAQKKLPTGVSDAASVRIARKWVTSNLSDWELLNALVYVYGRHYEVYTSLCNYLNRERSKKILSPQDGIGLRDTMVSPTYVKLSNLDSYRHKSIALKIRKDFELPSKFAESFESISESYKEITSAESALDYFLNMAKATFSAWGYHIHMLHLFDDKWNVIQILSTEFEDQADKYFFWRSIGERVAALNVGAIVWTAELWQRNVKQYPNVAIKNLPIIGEGLHVVVIDRNGNFLEQGWTISRDTEGNNPSLSGISDVNTFALPNYLAPVCRAMGGAAEQRFNEFINQSKSA